MAVRSSCIIKGLSRERFAASRSGSYHPRRGPSVCRRVRNVSGAKDGDRGPTVPSPLGAVGQRFVRSMLDRQQRTKRGVQPAFGQPRGETEVVRWVGKGDIVGAVGESFDESKRIGAVDASRVARAE